MSMLVLCPWCRRGVAAVVAVAVVMAAGTASAAPGGRGGGGRGGPGAGGGGRGGPGGPGGAAPRGGFQSGPGQAGPGRGVGGPAGAGGPGGVGGPGGAGNVRGPAGIGGVAGPAGVGGPAAARPADVERFLGAQPGSRPGTPATHAAINGRTQPFTSSWYAEHPSAWRYAHPYAGDWWAAAGVAGVYAWLGYPVTGTTAAATAPVATTDAAGAAATPPPADLEWLPLGVFVTGPKGAEQPHIYLQLAVSKAGEIKGNYYDAVSDATQPISGAIDKDSRKATWTVGKGATFETTLDALLKTPSDVTMRAGSATQTWQLAQTEKPK